MKTKKVIVADMYFHKKHKKLNLALIHEISAIASILIINKRNYYSYDDLSEYDSLNIFHYLPGRFDKLRNLCMLLHLILLSIVIKIRNIKYDKIIFLATNNICCHYALLLKLFKNDSIVVVHHYDIDRTIESLRESELFKKRMNEYDHIVFAQFIKDGIVEFLGTNEDRIYIVPHPIFISTKETVKKTDKNNIIIGAGRNNDLKFLSNLVEIDREAKSKSINHIKMRTNGSAYYGKNLEVFCKQDISQYEFDELLYSAKACVVIYPETYRYRYSGVIVDALSHGCIVICNEIPIGQYYKSICPNNCMIVKKANELYEMAFTDIAEFDYTEFSKYLNENSDIVIREKLYEVIHK